ncbi:MAG: type II secretion system GspH family protein [Patescibacteria group bacterium]|nr:type II secretion system GspH family protein [Patescibacteria group bacterium]
MRKNGFTLIELLVVMSILAIMTALVAINIQGNIGKARDARRKSDLRQIKSALTLYYNNYGYYPPSDNGNHEINGCDGGDCSWGSVWTYNNVNYMKILPADPTQSATYTYGYQRVDVNSFNLWAKLEVTADPDIAKTQTQCGYSGQYLYVLCAD